MKILTFMLTAPFLIASLYAADKPINTQTVHTSCERAQHSAIERIKNQFGVKAICACKEIEGTPVLQCKADKGAEV
jgi:hypothetical protein